MASERYVAESAWTEFEAEGVEGELQFRRDSNQHGRHILDVVTPGEYEAYRHECLENNTKPNVGKT